MNKNYRFYLLKYSLSQLAIAGTVVVLALLPNLIRMFVIVTFPFWVLASTIIPNILVSYDFAYFENRKISKKEVMFFASLSSVVSLSIALGLFLVSGWFLFEDPQNNFLVHLATMSVQHYAAYLAILFIANTTMVTVFVCVALKLNTNR